jgi:eukaryotic-like serine/threonine-protein kinase
MSRIAVLALLVLGSGLVLLVQSQAPARLMWVARDGTERSLGTLPAATYAPRLSPDGRQVAYDANGFVWIAPIDNVGAARRLSAGAYPMWSGDGTRLLFIIPVNGREQLFWQAADGSGLTDPLVDTARAPESWSEQAQAFTFITLTGSSDYDVWSYSLRDRMRRPFAALPGSNQSASRFSPDGRWVAYESNDSGAWEIYAAPFPGPGERVKLTTGGGRRPVWSGDGTELIYDREDRQLHALPLRVESSTIAGGTSRPLPVRGFMQAGARRQYDAAPDGSRFLMMFR